MPEQPRSEVAQIAPLPGTGNIPPFVLLLTGMGSVQFGAAIAVTIFDELGAAGASMLRVVLAAVMLLAVWRPTVRGLGRETWVVVLLFGFVLAAMNLSFYEALDRIPLGSAVTIEFIGPLGVALALSRKASHVVPALLAAAGIILLTHPWYGDFDGVGVGFALFAGACWAAYILIARRASGLFSGSDGVAIAMAVGAVLMLVPGILDGGSALLSPSMIAIGAGVAVLSSVIPYSVETEALRRMDARVFGVLMSLEPGIAAFAGYLLVGQHLGPMELAGIGLVVLASVSATRTATPEA